MNVSPFGARVAPSLISRRLLPTRFEIAAAMPRPTSAMTATCVELTETDEWGVGAERWTVLGGSGNVPEAAMLPHKAVRWPP
jgi:hypothetical protein